MPHFECPTCSKTTHVADVKDAPWRPFCSQRCKLIDLGRWLDGTYSVSEPLPSEPPAIGDAGTTRADES